MSTFTCCVNCCRLTLPRDDRGFCPDCVQENPAVITNLVEVDPTTALLAERGQQYGPSPFNQATIGKAWTAILESHFQIELPKEIPPHIVAIMMVALKLLRASTPFEYHQDNYDDMHGYVKIAEKCAKPESGAA